MIIPNMWEKCSKPPISKPTPFSFPGKNWSHDAIAIFLGECANPMSLNSTGILLGRS